MSMYQDQFVHEEGILTGQLAVKSLLSRYHQSPAVVLGSFIGVSILGLLATETNDPLILGLATGAIQEVHDVVEKTAPAA